MKIILIHPLWSPQIALFVRKIQSREKSAQPHHAAIGLPPHEQYVPRGNDGNGIGKDCHQSIVLVATVRSPSWVRPSLIPEAILFRSEQG